MERGSQVTERQLNAMWMIARSMGWASETLRNFSVEKMGHPQTSLSMREASRLISILLELRDRARKCPG